MIINDETGETVGEYIYSRKIIVNTFDFSPHIDSIYKKAMQGYFLLGNFVIYM